MPTRVNSIGHYATLAPQLQDTLRRNGMQARLVRQGDGVLLAVQGHDSPLLTYPLSQGQLSAMTDGGTNSSNRKAYEAFAAVVGGDFHLPKDYIHARNANGRVVMDAPQSAGLPSEPLRWGSDGRRQAGREDQAG